MWDYLMMTGSLLLAPALMPIMLRRNASLPMASSCLTAVGIMLFLPALVMNGLLLSATTTAANAACWWFIAIFRHTREDN